MKSTFTTCLLLLIATCSFAYDRYTGRVYYQTDSNSDWGMYVTYLRKDANNRSAYTGSITVPRIVDNTNGRHVTGIGTYAFCYCANMTSITLPESIAFKFIESYAFLNCSGLSEITIPVGVLRIGYCAFKGCSNITIFNTNNPVPPTVSKDAFDEQSLNNSTLKVPTESFGLYHTANVWKDFNNIESIDGYIKINGTSIYVYDELKTYTLNNNQLCSNFQYTRTFNNTNLQPLYVPFSMSYADWCEDFNVYSIKNFIDYEGETVLEISKVKETDEALLPNHPYFIQAKTAGEKTIAIENTTLYAAEENSVECLTDDYRYVFTGTYSKMSGLKTAGFYGMSGGKLCPAANDDVTLGAFRWYLKIEDKNGLQTTSAPKQIKIRVSEDDAAGIENAFANNRGDDGKTYSIDGREVDGRNLQRGLYIKNGKKFYVK